MGPRTRGSAWGHRPLLEASQTDSEDARSSEVLLSSFSVHGEISFHMGTVVGSNNSAGHIERIAARFCRMVPVSDVSVPVSGPSLGYVVDGFT